MGFKYRDRHSDDFNLAVQTNPHILPSFENKTTKVPGRPGEHYQNSDYGMRQIPVTIAFVGKDIQDYEERLRLLSDWLRPDLGVGVYRSDNEPDKYYNAVLSSQDFGRINNIAKMGEGQLTFVCPDPFAYEVEEQTNTLPDAIPMFGTAETHPILTVDVNEPITHLEITNHSNQTIQGTPKSIVLGKPASMTDTTIEREQLVMHELMQDVNSWQTATDVDNGYIDGQMASDDVGFYADTFGGANEPFAWQGPSLIKSIGQSLNDFRADIKFRLLNTEYETGMIEVYFRDQNGVVVAKIGFEDIWRDKPLTQAKAQIGDQASGHDIYTRADREHMWNDFDGIMRLERIDNIWYPYWAIIEDDGTHNWVRGNIRYTDNERAFMNPITDVQVAIRKWPSKSGKEAYMRVSEMKIYQINEPQSESEVPYIAQAGDTITINPKDTQPVRRNGEPVGITALNSDFWSLIPGVNDITVEPSNAVNAGIRYQNAHI